MRYGDDPHAAALQQVMTGFDAQVLQAHVTCTSDRSIACLRVSTGQDRVLPDYQQYLCGGGQVQRRECIKD
jgi:hypothetical protein